MSQIFSQIGNELLQRRQVRLRDVDRRLLAHGDRLPGRGASASARVGAGPSLAERTTARRTSGQPIPIAGSSQRIRLAARRVVVGRLVEEVGADRSAPGSRGRTRAESTAAAGSRRSAPRPPSGRSVGRRAECRPRRRTPGPLAPAPACLARAAELVMQPAQHAARRAGVVVLHELDVTPTARRRRAG